MSSGGNLTKAYADALEESKRVREAAENGDDEALLQIARRGKTGGNRVAAFLAIKGEATMLNFAMGLLAQADDGTPKRRGNSLEDVAEWAAKASARLSTETLRGLLDLKWGLQARRILSSILKDRRTPVRCESLAPSVAPACLLRGEPGGSPSERSERLPSVTDK